MACQAMYKHPEQPLPTSEIDVPENCLVGKFTIDFVIDSWILMIFGMRKILMS